MDARKDGNMVNMEDPALNQAVEAAQKKVADCLSKWDMIGLLDSKQKHLLNVCNGQLY
jgi:hypothetical protein